ncbi:MAG TPA: hypothetical protein PLQ93_04480 [Bacteroidia bacterium]|nr:hypothetical protein [Bacteroidia bacterium]
MSSFQQAYQRFISGTGFEKQNLWFKRLLYAFLIYKCIHWNYFFDFLLAEDTYLFHDYSSIGPFKDLAFLLLKYPISGLSRIVLVGVLVIAVYRLFFQSPIVLAYICDLLLWFMVLNLNNKMYAGLSGGNLLLNQLLLFNVFISKHGITGAGFLPDLRRLLQSFAILAIRLQLMLLYLVSAVCKLHYSEWLQGSAIASTLQIEHFSLVGSLGQGYVSGLLMVLINYLILFYQLLFPVLIWFKALARYFLMFGIAMHVFIGLYMGLPDFAMIMLLAYFYVWPKKSQVAPLPDLQNKGLNL